MRLIQRTGEASVRTKLIQIIDAETEKPVTMPELINQLKDRGVDAKINVTRTGKIRGISYQLDGIATSGTHLGRAYTFGGLQKHRQISYDYNLDRRELIEASNEEKERILPKQIEIARTQQIERSLIIAPILRDYINGVKQANIETPDYRISWQKEEQTLYLYKKPETEPRLKILYQNQEFIPIESASSTKNQPMLTSADINYWQQFHQKLHLYIEQKKAQQEKEQKTLKRRRRR